MFRWLPRYPNGVLKRPSCYKFFTEIKFFSASPRLRGATGFLRFFSVSQCLRGGFWVWLWLCYAVCPSGAPSTPNVFLRERFLLLLSRIVNGPWAIYRVV